MKETIFTIILIVLLTVAGIFAGIQNGENIRANETRQRESFATACRAVNGVPTFDSKQYVCLQEKQNADSSR